MDQNISTESTSNRVFTDSFIRSASITAPVNVSTASGAVNGYNLRINLPKAVTNSRKRHPANLSESQRRDNRKMLMKNFPTFKTHMKGEQVVEWMRRADDLAARGCPTDDHHSQIDMVRQYIDANAQIFLRAYDQNPDIIPTWDSFLLLFFRQYGDLNQSSRALAELQKFTQGDRTVTQFTSELKLLALQCHMYGSYWLNNHFVSGLRFNIQNKMGIFDENAPLEDLELMALAAERQISMQRVHHPVVENKPKYQHTNRDNRESNTTITTSKSYTSDRNNNSIQKKKGDLDKVLDKGHLNIQERQRRLDKNLCMYCGKHSKDTQCYAKEKSQDGKKAVNNVNSSNEPFVVDVLLSAPNGATVPARALIDSGLQCENLLRKDIAVKLGLNIHEHPNPWTAQAFNFITLADINEQVQEVTVNLHGHESVDNFAIVLESAYDVMLGDEWCLTHVPTTSSYKWNSKHFISCHVTNTTKPHYQSSLYSFPSKFVFIHQCLGKSF